MKATLFLNVLLGSALFGGIFLVRPAASQVTCTVNGSPCEAPAATTRVVQPQPCRVETCPQPAVPVAPVAPANCSEATPCVPAQTQVVVDEFPGNFVCEDDYLPTTMFYAPEGTLPVIRWRSHYFAGSGYTPQVRCREVTNRFQRFYEAGTLNYITTGIVNRLPVVCVSSEFGGPCQGVLLTLRPDENPSQVVQQLFDISYANSGPLYESGSRVYLDMNAYLNQLREQQRPNP